MCYVCRKPVTDYNHFGESIGKYNSTIVFFFCFLFTWIVFRCPLWTKDLRKFHENEVKQGAISAKVDLGVDKEPGKLKIDPAKDL